ncbi:MAG TPA: hypothetical protein VJR89_07900 [Polyangiales bacterium]|nr:hypothetical protein [Polyangiales bacterium]
MRLWLERWVVSCVLLCAACGDDADDTKSSSKDAGDHDKDKEKDAGAMLIPRGGRSGNGGAGGTGGSSSAGDAYLCKPKPGDVGGAAPSGAECCGGLGTCQGGLGAGSGLPHATCSANPDLRCAPKPTASDADGGSDAPRSCRVQLPGSPASAPSYEGRCLPSCFAAASPIGSRLSQATCETGELCTPCYNPLTGRTTGTCERGGDSPLDPPPPGFQECANGLGYCVPMYAAGNAAAQLSRLTCAAGELCAPKIKVADPNACFEHCSAEGLGPGACVPDFLAGPLSSLLSRSSCGTGELCAPCDALGTRTGVCD